MLTMHPLFHKFKSVIGYSIATVVIVIALGVSGIRFLLTTANLYHDEVEQLASKLLEQPVKIGSMDAKLSGLVPTIIFHKVQMLSKKDNNPLFSLSRIDVGISFESLLLYQKITPQYITVRGANLNITRTSNEEIKIEGINVGNLTATKQPEDNKQVNSIIEKWLLSRSEIAIENSSIVWRDEKNGKLRWVFDDVNFLLKNNDTHHQLSLQGSLPDVLGDKIKLDIDIDGDIKKPQLWKAKLFVESKNINLIPLGIYINKKNLKVKNGSSALKLWADIEQGRVTRLSGDVKLDNIEYQYKKKDEARVNYASAIFDASLSENNVWNVSVDRFYYKNNERVWSESRFNLAFNYLNEKFENLYIKADYLRLGMLSQIVRDHNLVREKNIKSLQSLDVHGDVHDFMVSWQDNEINKIKADFIGFSVNAWKNIPAVKNISGQFFYEDDQGKVYISSKKSSVNFAKLFRDELTFNDFIADVNFLNTDQGLLFELDYLSATNNDASTESRASLWFPKDDSSPYLDFYTHVSNGKVAKISKYLPAGIMAVPLVNWLDKSIVSGKVNRSTIIFSGKLNDFPFKHNEGTFTVDVDASDVVIDYQKDWPIIEKAKLNARFSGRGMQLHLSQGKSSNLELTDSYAKIPSFTQAKLEMNLSVKGSLRDAAAYLVNSPIMPAAKEIVSSIELAGTTSTSAKINIPLGHDLRKREKISYAGYSILKNTSAGMLDKKINIEKLNGKVFFNEKEIYAKNLQADLMQKKVEIAIVTEGKDKRIKVLAKGKVAPGLLLSRFEIPGAHNVHGETSYTGNIVFPGKKSGFQYPVLTMQSDLQNIKSVFPDFLQKNKKNKQPLTFKAVFKKKNTTQFELYFNNGSGVFEIEKLKAGNVILKKGAVSFSPDKAKLPRNNVLYIDGKIEQLTPSEWFTSLGLNKKNKSPVFFVNPIVLNLSELALLTEDNKNNKANSPMDPKIIPKIDGIINKLFLNKDFLGRLDFKTSKRNYGMHLDEFILSARNMKLVAQGEWRHNRGNPGTNIDLTLSTKDFGNMLTDLGFSAIIKHGEAQAVSKLRWDGTPAQFQLDRLNGTIQLNLENGDIVDIDPSAGRLLGFFSLAALPRKLFGDFKSSVAEGFSFDKAKGQIIIRDGNAYTDGFEIISPIADVSVSGRTGLAARDYDNNVKVVPAVGEGVTGLVALLVNIPAGIGLWLVDKITGEQFNEASTRFYEIKGSWAKPEIKLVKEEPG